MSRLSTTVNELIESGWSLKSLGEYLPWFRRALAFLTNAVSNEAARQFKILSSSDDWRDGRDGQIGFLEAVLVREEQTGEKAEKEEAVVALARVASLPKPSKRVFVVHGHDEEAKQTMARFLEHIGLEPVILRPTTRA
jgi:hypothetical protein